MSTLDFRDYEILAADIGVENYMPDIKNVEYIHAGYTLAERVNPEDAENIGKGMIRTMLPYTLQDNYNRDRKVRKFHAAILENNKLRAVFLPELGGRLWSLYHKVLERELLYVNPIFQPGNLALRNAWFSGGVEWNIGIKGHNPLTCSPMYACHMEDAKGTPVLRMYEFERIREVVYSMDFMLPEDSDILYVKTTVENTSTKDKYMYWWSNIAVPESYDTRVIAPCEEALKTHYGEEGYVIDTVSIPFPDVQHKDCTYPRNAPCSNDYFYRLEKEKKKWITAVEKDGIGLLQFSTSELIGRKLFLWGQGQGGRNWNQWLAGEPVPYVEIQAGLARTQYEHIQMKGKSEISWVEGYTVTMCDPQKVHGDFRTAVDTVSAFVGSVMPTEQEMRAMFDDLKEGQIEQYGSAWGYVANCLREKQGEAAISTRLAFPEEAVKQEECIWLNFLRTGVMKEENMAFPPISFHTDKYFLDLFEAQIAMGEVNAYMYLQYGIVLYANEKVEEAYQAFLKSNECQPNAWAYRNLSMIEMNEYDHPTESLVYIEKAIALNNTYRGLMINCAQIMLKVKAYDKWLKVFHNLDRKLKEDSRLQLYKAVALIETEQYEKASEIICPDFLLCDIKEGEVSLSHIWKRLYTKLVQRETGISDEQELEILCEEKYPLPAHLDFRMDK